LATNEIAQTGLSSLPPVIYYSEQLFRVYGVILALDAVRSLNENDNTKSIAWLHQPAKGLGGKMPAELLSTSVGVQAVVDLVGRIEHGVY
ncbi:antitoxin Xre/MbcA/ParS toxin-binding domain-containing protein, partial [Aeromonas veronii]